MDGGTLKDLLEPEMYREKRKCEKQVTMKWATPKHEARRGVREDCGLLKENQLLFECGFLLGG